MFKKKCSWLLGLLLTFVLMLGAPAFAAPSVVLDGRQLTFDVQAVVENNRTLVPLRAIFEAMGATVTWNQDTQTATAFKDSTTVVIKLGSTTPTINGQIQQLDVPAKAINGRTLAPLRFVGEAFGGSVSWNQESQLITIQTAPGTGTELIKVHLIDVGQADSIYIQLPDHVDVLIDGGNVADGQLVCNYLRAQGVDDIELMIATHPHEDHIGGLPAVLSAFKVDEIIDSGATATTKCCSQYSSTAAAEGCPRLADNKQSFTWGNSVLQILTGSETWDDANDYSVVCRLDTGNIEFLFTGDASTSVENILRGDLNAEILKVGHHGSSYSSSSGFLSRVMPDLAIISVGTGNTYGHPTAAALSRLMNIGSNIYRTDLNGTVVVTTDGNTYSVTTENNTAAQTPVVSTPIAPVVTPVPVVPVQSTGLYVGSIKSDKYHYPSCRYAQAILPANEIWFNNEAEALAAGYVPCKVCRP